MRAWLCLNPVRLQMTTVGGQEVNAPCPKEALALLAVFRTTKLGREINGRKAQFLPVDWPKTGKGA